MCRSCDEEASQKAIVAFAVGLLIGGMLVWAFSGPMPESVEQQTGPAPKALTAVETCIEKGGVPITQVLSGGRENLIDCKGI